MMMKSMKFVVPVLINSESLISSRPKSSPGNRTTNVGGKKCRVLFSYQPAHEDELELKVGIRNCCGLRVGAGGFSDYLGN